MGAERKSPGLASSEGGIVQRIYLGTTTQVIVELAPGLRVVALEQNTARSRPATAGRSASGSSSDGTRSMPGCSIRGKEL